MTEFTKYNEPLRKVYINVYDWGCANKIYTSKKQADKDAQNRVRYLCIETYISRSQLQRYNELKRGSVK